jgi:hypothetical protein
MLDDPGRTAQPCRMVTLQFLLTLETAGDKFTFQTFGDNRKDESLVRVLHGTLDQHWNELVELNNRGAGVFVTVNETDLKGRKTENITKVRALFVDLDGAPLHPVTAGSTPPHIIVVSSPGRWHCYWLVSDVPLEAFKPLQKALIARFNADPSVHDLPRVMRLPGFIHRKGEPFPSTLQDVDGLRPHYTLAQMRAAFPPAPEPGPEPSGTGTDRRRGEAWAQAALTASAHELANAPAGTRHATLLAKSVRMGTMTARGWIDTHEVRRALFAAAETNGQIRQYGLGHFNDTFRDGIAHGTRAPHPDLPANDGPHERLSPAPTQPRRRETGTWDEPDASILDDRRGDLPEFPLDCFPAVTHDWIRSAARGAGVTIDHIATPLIGIASSAIGIARRVQATKSWLAPMTCWACLVGPSGSGKTPAIDTVKRALSLIERDRRGETEALRLAHETRVEAAKATLKKWKDEVATAIEDGQPPPPKPPGALDIGPFVAPRLYVNDSTIERLAALIEARPNGMTFIADELARLFLNMQRYSNGSDREFWLEAWDGKSFTVERKGSPPISVPHLLVGVIGGFQPDKLARSFEGDADGIYARFLYAWPSEPAFAPPADDVDEIDPEIINAFGWLLRLPVIEDGVFVPRNLPLSQSALGSFRQFLHFLHQRKAELDGREREYWCKGSAHVLRLAGTLCLLEWAWTGGPEPHAIDAGHVESAVTLWSNYYWPHGCAALRQMGLSDKHIEARRVLRWVRANDRREVSLKDIRRDALKQRLDAEDTQAVIDGLVRAGWLRQVTTRTPGRALHRYEVNPQLFSLDLGAGSAASAGRGGEDPVLSTPPTLPAVPALPAWEPREKQGRADEPLAPTSGPTLPAVPAGGPREKPAAGGDQGGSRDDASEPYAPYGGEDLDEPFGPGRASAPDGGRLRSDRCRARLGDLCSLREGRGRLFDPQPV